MAHTKERIQDARASKEMAVRLAARQRLAVRIMTLPAVLAALAALLQAYDSFEGIGSYWSVLVSVGAMLWWIIVAIFLSDRRPRGQAPAASVAPAAIAVHRVARGMARHGREPVS
ncbi:hypothetical protein SAMN05519103_06123 [Rhizobiales bacterium GAS113]|nr:hypothetical protein SAMN05519103_06123 [Rhizobiales bacterium GAS113]